MSTPSLRYHDDDSREIAVRTPYDRDFVDAMKSLIRRAEP